MKTTINLISLFTVIALSLQAQMAPPGAAGDQVLASPVPALAIAPYSNGPPPLLVATEPEVLPLPVALPLPVPSPEPLLSAAPAPAALVLDGSKVVSRNGPHRVTFAYDASTQGAVDLTTPSGQRLQSTVFGLIYLDPASGRSVLIAHLKPSVAALLPPNQLVYPDAFAGEGVSADLLYTYTGSSTGGSLEQDVIVRRQLPGPEQYSMPSTSRLGVMTEFFEPPAPRQISGVIDLSAQNQQLGIQGEATMPDATLVFSGMRIIAGKAFLLGQNEPNAPVAKSWQVLEGRTFLTESTPYALLKPQLAALPALAGGPAVRQAVEMRTALRQGRSAPAVTASTAAPRVAQAGVAATPGVVLDYVIVTDGVKLLNVNFGQTNPFLYLGGAAVGAHYINVPLASEDGWNGYMPLTNFIVLSHDIVSF
jgi:hypothetical protein